MYTLPETELMKIQTVSEDDRMGMYVIEPLSPGYGVTIGNALRRVLLSSLAGAAVSSVRIDGATHEFTTMAGMQEDIVELILNLKTLRVKLLSEEPAVLRLDAKGPGPVTAAKFAKNAQVELVDADHYLATLDKNGKLSLEVTIEHGRGYVPTEQKDSEQLPLGTIMIDSTFTPVKKVHYEVENTRVGGMTNFDKLMLDITTDGTIHPRIAVAQAAKILLEHFDVVRQVEDMVATKKATKKSAKTAASEIAAVETVQEEAPKKPAKAKVSKK